MPQTALVTGVSGQDGRLLAALLSSHGQRVVGVVRPGREQTAALGDVQAEHVVGDDLADPAAVAALLDRWQPDAIYHLAAFHHAAQEGSVSSAVAGKESMVATNFLTTKTLALELLQARSPCPLVYAASSQMYTPLDDMQAVDESTPRSPSTWYGHTKSWSTDLLAFLRRESGLNASTAILFNHESALRPATFVSRKITRAAAQAALGLEPRLELYNTATRVDWSSAHDVVDALQLMAGSATPADYVVASGSLHTVQDLLEAAFGKVGLDWQRYTTVREHRPTPALVGRPQALERQLGWTRRIGFKQMVAEMVDHDLAGMTSGGGAATAPVFASASPSPTPG